MRKNYHQRLCLTALLASALVAGAALAQIPIEKARAIALHRVPGKLLEEESGHENGRVIYSFEIRPKGEKTAATEVKVDAESGKIVSVGTDAEDEGPGERDEKTAPHH